MTVRWTATMAMSAGRRATLDCRVERTTTLMTVAATGRDRSVRWGHSLWERLVHRSETRRPLSLEQ